MKKMNKVETHRVISENLVGASIADGFIVNPTTLFAYRLLDAPILIAYRGYDMCIPCCDNNGKIYVCIIVTDSDCDGTRHTVDFLPFTKKMCKERLTFEGHYEASYNCAWVQLHIGEGSSFCTSNEYEATCGFTQ